MHPPDRPRSLGPVLRWARPVSGYARLAVFQKTAAETGLSVTVLGGEKLIDKVADRLEETLKDEIGITSASIKNFAQDMGRGVVIGLRLTY